MRFFSPYTTTHTFIIKTKILFFPHSHVPQRLRMSGLTHFRMSLPLYLLFNIVTKEKETTNIDSMSLRHLLCWSGYDTYWNHIWSKKIFLSRFLGGTDWQRHVMKNYYLTYRKMIRDSIFVSLFIFLWMDWQTKSWCVLSGFSHFL